MPVLEQIHLLNLSTNALIAYIVSWGVFFLTLPVFVHFFGRIRGAAIDYGVSWVVMAGMMYLLHGTMLPIMHTV